MGVLQRLCGKPSILLEFILNAKQYFSGVLNIAFLFNDFVAFHVKSERYSRDSSGVSEPSDARRASSFLRARR
jgi:hypothetical protein